ncbi:hypothetical protein G9A89_004032 [Geosiphon pyriformis]|nr:hypothetical protein G9A89_004032 [Geosiphon pyriformis]
MDLIITTRFSQTIMMPSLIFDCYYQIFEYLEQNRTTLHACILVNRQWCQAAVPILWRQPFSLLYNFPHPSDYSLEAWQMRAGQLVETLFLSLTEEEKKSLRKKKLSLPSFTNSTIHNRPTPIFNYAGFMRIMDFGEAYGVLLAWIRYSKGITGSCTFQVKPSLNQISPPKKILRSVIKLLGSVHFVRNKKLRTELAVCKTFAKLLMRKSWTMKSLIIDKIHHSPVPEELLFIGKYPGSKNCLSQLTNLICTTKSNKAKFLLAISKVSHHLRNLTIWISYPSTQSYPYKPEMGRRSIRRRNEVIEQAEALVQLIQSQDRLISFEIGYCPTALELIVDSLKTQAKSLRRINFHGVNFSDARPLTGLANCHRLEKLKFITCVWLNERALQPLTTIKFPYLRKIDVNTPIPSSVISAIIKNSNWNIEKLKFEDVTTATDTITPKVIQTIAEHCPNLVRLSYRPTIKEMPQLVQLVTNCKKLATLILTGARYPEIDVNSVFRDMAKQQLPNLKHLSIQTALTLTPNTLNEFFTISKAPIETLEFYQAQCFCDHHLDVVLNCLKPTLKNLRIQTYRTIPDTSIVRAREIIEFVHVYPM